MVVTKDFSLIHDKPAETRAQVLAILRDVYDGYASRAFGNSAPEGYHARFNYLAGMTPDIEKSWSLNTLGERFLMYRIQIDDRRQHARRALDNVRGKKGSVGVRKELQVAVRRSMDGVKRFEPEVGDDMAERISDLAELLSTCRTYVHRDKNDDIPCLPQAELAARVSKQLMRVGMSVALVRGRRAVGDDEYAVMKRIALDSLPTNRRLLLAALYEHRAKSEPLETFAGKVSRIAKTTVRRELENLAELDAVERVKQQVSVPGPRPKKDGTEKEVKTTKILYWLSAEFARYRENVGGYSPLFNFPVSAFPPERRRMVDANGKPAVTNGKPSGKKGGDALVLALATGLSVPQAAKKARIGVNTAYVRMRDPEFRQEVARARDDLLAQAVGRLVAASCEAVDALSANLSDESPAVRNKATATILSTMIQGVGLTEIMKRLEALEESGR